MDVIMARGEIEALFVAGQRARPGVYRQVESRRIVRLDAEDYLPASLDGHVACYICLGDSGIKRDKNARQCQAADRLICEPGG